MTTSIPGPRWHSIGPHGFYDLVRLARRGRSTLVRVAYLLALFAVLAAVHHQTRESAEIDERDMRFVEEGIVSGRLTESINTNARIAERFSIAILIMQNIAVLLLMPIYVASSVHEERDRRTLPILFTTHLTAREIVLGKWLARVGHVGSILLAGLPILSFVQLWGGIDMPMIAANFVNTGCWLASVGSLSMMMATQSRTLARAVVKTYLAMLAIGLVLTCCCLPMDFHVDRLFLPRPAGGPHAYAAMGVDLAMLVCIHLFHTVLFLWRGTHNLEQQRGDAPMGPDVFDVDLEPMAGPIRVNLPPIPDNALVWKERQLGRPIWGVAPLFVAPFLVYIVIVQLVAIAAASFGSGRVASDEQPHLFAAIALFSFSIYLLHVSYRLAGCVVGERERQTLDPLLTLPITRSELLRAKVHGTLLRYWTWLVPVGIAWLAVLLINFRIAAITLLLFAALAIHLAFFAMLGLFLSVVCRTSVAAYVSLSTVLLLTVIGTLAAPWLLPWNDWITTIANPVACWIMILSADPNLPGAFLGLTVYMILAQLLWVGASEAFARRDC